MTVQTMTMTYWEYYPQRKKDDLGAFDNLPDGTDILHRLYGLFRHCKRSDLRKSGSGNYVEVTEVQPVGRSLLVTFSVGRSGVAGEVRDEDSKVTYRHGVSETHTISTQVLFVHPPGSSALMMFADQTHGRSARKPVMDLIKARWTGTFSKHTLNAIAVTYGAAWLQAAEVEGVTAIVHSFGADLSDGMNRQPVGRIRHEITPLKGLRTLLRGNKFKKALENGTVSGALVGLEEDPDEVRVTLGDGEQSRTFVVGRDARTPIFRTVLAEDGEAPRRGDDFVAACRSECLSANRTLSVSGFAWDDRNLSGDWGAAEKSIKWEHQSG